MGPLLEIRISDFRGIASFKAIPDGQSLTLRGDIGTGKSSAIDALWWAVGGILDGEVVRNGAERARVEVRFDDYAVTRQKVRGKPATLRIKSAEGVPLGKSPKLLAGFLGAVKRQTFSMMSAKEQAEVLREIAPGLEGLVHISPTGAGERLSSPRKVVSKGQKVEV